MNSVHHVRSIGSASEDQDCASHLDSSHLVSFSNLSTQTKTRPLTRLSDLEGFERVGASPNSSGPTKCYKLVWAKKAGAWKKSGFEKRRESSPFVGGYWVLLALDKRNSVPSSHREHRAMRRGERERTSRVGKRSQVLHESSWSNQHEWGNGLNFSSGVFLASTDVDWGLDLRASERGFNGSAIAQEFLLSSEDGKLKLSTEEILHSGLCLLRLMRIWLDSGWGSFTRIGLRRLSITRVTVVHWWMRLSWD